MVGFGLDRMEVGQGWSDSDWYSQSWSGLAWLDLGRVRTDRVGQVRSGMDRGKSDVIKFCLGIGIARVGACQSW